MIDEMRGLPETKKLIRLGLLALLVWTAGTALFLEASAILNSSKERIMDTGRILDAANTFYSYPSRSSAEGREPLSLLTDAINELNLKGQVGLMNSGSSGLTVQMTALNGAEFISFLKRLSEKGLQVRTADIRAINSAQKGRLINASMLIGATGDDSL
ncbi:MAG: hypothetical protein U2P59_00605 [Synergistota bacterium]|nr:hypothetical protein [Synergistota bacterium]